MIMTDKTMSKNSEKDITNIVKIVYDEALKAYQTKDDSRALSLFYELFKRKNYHVGVCFFGGMSAFRQKQWKVAEEMLSKTIEIGENEQYSLQSRIFLSIIYIRNEKWNEAKESLQKAVKKPLNDPLPYALMGYIANKENRYQEAEKMFQKSLELDKNNPNFNNNLGFNYLEWDEKYLDKAQHYISIALKAEKDNYHYLHSMGKVLFLRKECEKAVKVLEKSLKIMPNKETEKDLKKALETLKNNQQ